MSSWSESAYVGGKRWDRWVEARRGEKICVSPAASVVWRGWSLIQLCQLRTHREALRRGRARAEDGGHLRELVLVLMRVLVLVRVRVRVLQRMRHVRRLPLLPLSWPRASALLLLVRGTWPYIAAPAYPSAAGPPDVEPACPTLPLPLPLPLPLALVLAPAPLLLLLLPPPAVELASLCLIDCDYEQECARRPSAEEETDEEGAGDPATAAAAAAAFASACGWNPEWEVVPAAAATVALCLFSEACPFLLMVLRVCVMKFANLVNASAVSLSLSFGRDRSKCCASQSSHRQAPAEVCDMHPYPLCATSSRRLSETHDTGRLIESI